MSSGDSDFSYFNLSVDGVFSTTSATTTALSFSSGTHTISISGVDTTGNTSATTTQTIVVQANPVVLNELSYFGTETSRSDEWVELYNKTGNSISLSGWTLYADDGAPYIPLNRQRMVHD